MIDRLYRHMDDEKIVFIEDDLTSINLKGLYFDNFVVLDRNIDTVAEKQCILAEEVGHHETSTMPILDQRTLHNEREEQKARRWAVNHLVSPIDLIKAYEHGISSKSELAEFLGVTEEFVEITIKQFLQIYGPEYAIDEYVIFFDPLWVYKALE